MFAVVFTEMAVLLLLAAFGSPFYLRERQLFYKADP
jgi:hypothetical protein